MIVGIVGAEGAKFTTLGRSRAFDLITHLLDRPGVTQVVSGACHLGGIDIWAAEIGHTLKLSVVEYPPQFRTWEYYKTRNWQIALHSDIVHCIAVDVLPKEYVGMRFPLCYHCKTNDHVKSGGCWTMIKAIACGKLGQLHIVSNY